MTLYRAEEAAEIIELCAAAGIAAAKVAAWLREGRSAAVIAANLRWDAQNPASAVPAGKPADNPAPAEDWAELRAASAERLAQRLRR